MNATDSPHPIEFVKLDGVAIRVTGWRAGTEPGAYDLVAITRGSRDAETLDDLFRRPRLALEAGNQSARTVRVAAIDRRTVGEGQAGITRYAVTFVEADAETDPEHAPGHSPSTLEERLSALENEVRALRASIEQHTNRDRH